MKTTMQNAKKYAENYLGKRFHFVSKSDVLLLARLILLEHDIKKRVLYKSTNKLSDAKNCLIEELIKF